MYMCIRNWPSTGHSRLQTCQIGPHRLPSRRNTGSYRVIQHVINVTNISHLAAGWTCPPGRPRKTWLQQVVADQDCDMDVIWSQARDRSAWDRYDPRWSDTAVSEWVHLRTLTSIAWPYVQYVPYFLKMYVLLYLVTPCPSVTSRYGIVPKWLNVESRKQRSAPPRDWCQSSCRNWLR